MPRAIRIHERRRRRDEGVSGALGRRLSPAIESVVAAFGVRRAGDAGRQHEGRDEAADDAPHHTSLSMATSQPAATGFTVTCALNCFDGKESMTFPDLLST